MKTDLLAWLPHGLTLGLLSIIGFFVKHELKDIKSRIVRLENFVLFGEREEKPHVF